MAVPWYMLSPNPITLIQYAILIFVGYKFFIKNIEYRRFSKLKALCDSACMLALFVFLTDAIWCATCALKWVSAYPQDTLQISASFLRDVVGAFLFYLLIGGYFKRDVVKFTSLTKACLGLCVVSMAVWFYFAPSIAYTDYTQAYQLGYSWSFILSDLFLSHFLMRIPLWVGFVAIFPKK